MHYKVYFILAHKNPSQLRDLIQLLQDESSFFFIHIDKKVAINPFKELIGSGKVFFVSNRVYCKWGDFSLVKATLNAFEEINEFMQKNKSSDSYHCIMLSGEDLPLKTNKDITFFLQSLPDTSFIHYWKLPYNKWWNGGLFRFESLYLFSYAKYQKLNYRLNKLIKKLRLHFLLPINKIKKLYPSFTFYGNSQWMILSHELILDIINISNSNKEFNSCFKYVLAPDELYFSSLIYNFGLEYKHKIKNVPTHFVVFEGVSPNPHYLTIDQIENNKSKDFLFARKFDESKNQHTISFIKSNLLK